MKETQVGDQGARRKTELGLSNGKIKVNLLKIEHEARPRTSFEGLSNHVSKSLSTKHCAGLISRMIFDGLKGTSQVDQSGH